MNRDKETFLEVLEAHRGIIFKVCNSYCTNLEDRKDLGQEIILQLWKSYPYYKETYKLSTWIYRIALNVSISHARKSRVRKRYPMLPLEEFIQISAEEGTPQEEIQLLQEFISQLDGLSKALMLLYLDGYSHEEIATLLHISQSNVGTKIGRIKRKLKKQFEAYEINGIR